MRDLVLVGGGHAHIEVLRRFALDPVPGTRLTAGLDRPLFGVLRPCARCRGGPVRGRGSRDRAAGLALLPLDARAFVLVDTTLQVVGHPAVFAAGDCAALRDLPETPKAGVYAVRQGPFMASDLRAFLDGQPPRRYRPQRDFLTLLNLADGTAAGTKWASRSKGAGS